MSLLSLTRTLRLSTLALVTVAGLAGCASANRLSTSMSSLGGMITPYKIDVVQGNVVVREQLEAVQPGMPRDQVAAVLGTPLLTSVFHGNRWDYVFTFKRRGEDLQQRRVTVFFKNDLLERIEADPLPSENEFVASLNVRHDSSAKAPALQASAEQLQTFKEKNPSQAAAAEPVAATPSGNYPPLESR